MPGSALTSGAWGTTRRVGRDHPPGLPDEQVLAIAVREGRILLTSDRDFGELVFSLGRPHAAVILFRLGPYAELSLQIERLEHVLVRHATQLDQFLVVTRPRVRVRRPDSQG